MTGPAVARRNGLGERDRVYLEKLLLAAEVILEAGEDPEVLNDAFQAELVLFRDRLHHALLLGTGPA